MKYPQKQEIDRLKIGNMNISVEGMGPNR